jgi:hypothetical protein
VRVTLAGRGVNARQMPMPTGLVSRSMPSVRRVWDRMPSAPYHQVVPSGGAVGERDVNTGVILLERGVCGAEPHLRAGLHGPVHQDPGKCRPVHAHGGGQVWPPGVDVVDFRDQRAVRVRCAQAERVVHIAVFLDLVPDAELAQDAQCVPLQGDAGAERSDVGFDVDELDRDAALGQQDGGRGASGATSDH